MPITTPFKSGGDRIRTCDLEVMSLASYLAAPPRVIFMLPGGHSNRDYYYYTMDCPSARSALSAGAPIWMPIK